MLDIVKQGKNDFGVWVVGTLTLGNLEIFDLFNTNLSKEIEDTTQPIKIKKLKIRRSNKTNDLRFSVEF